MINIAICDDEALQRSYLQKLVDQWANQHNVRVNIEQFCSAKSFKFIWSEDKNFDIVLLDIQMEGQNGVELAKEIREQDESMILVFITGVPDYIEEGYEVEALHYLMKPIKEEKFFEVLARAYSKVEKLDKSLLLDTNQGRVKVGCGMIHYIEAFGHSVEVHTQNTVYEVKENIGELEEKLRESSFVRTHRSYLVNLNTVSRITRTEVILDSEESVPLSRRLYKSVNEAFINHFKGEEI